MGDLLDLIGNDNDDNNNRDPFGFEDANNDASFDGEQNQELYDDSDQQQDGATGEESRFVITSREEKEKVMRTEIFAVVAGLVVIGLAFGVVGFIRKKQSNNRIKQTTQQTQQVAQQQNQQAQIQQQQVVTQVPAAQQQQSNTGGWTEFTGVEQDLTVSTEYTRTNFTVMSKKNFVRVVDGDHIEMKTTLYGAIAGMSGTYEIDVPVSKGTYIKAGMTFEIKVLIGDYSGKTVIDDISTDIG